MMDSNTTPRHWQPDHLGEGFEMTYVDMPDDYSGKVRCTVIRRKSDTPASKAILYVHGFSDYFIQKEMAEMFASNGYNFYAVDLRKYGRSLIEGQKMFQVRRLDEYFADINASIKIMTDDGNRAVALLGHSTGGLTTSLYMAKEPAPVIRALILNSPFLDWNLSPFMRKAVMPVVSILGRFMPGVKLPQKPDRGYAESLSKEYGGEWTYRKEWKPDILPDPDMGWARAIHKGQQELRSGEVKVPVLLMHSRESVRKGDPADKYHRADAILDVEAISHYGNRLGSDVTEVEFDGGLHDLALSRKSIRTHMYRVMLAWLSSRI